MGSSFPERQAPPPDLDTSPAVGHNHPHETPTSVVNVTSVDSPPRAHRGLEDMLPEAKAYPHDEAGERLQAKPPSPAEAYRKQQALLRRKEFADQVGADDGGMFFVSGDESGSAVGGDAQGSGAVDGGTASGAVGGRDGGAKPSAPPSMRPPSPTSPPLTARRHYADESKHGSTRTSRSPGPAERGLLLGSDGLGSPVPVEDDERVDAGAKAVAAHAAATQYMSSAGAVDSHCSPRTQSADAKYAGHVRQNRVNE